MPGSPWYTRTDRFTYDAQAVRPSKPLKAPKVVTAALKPKVGVGKPSRGNAKAKTTAKTKAAVVKAITKAGVV